MLGAHDAEVAAIKRGHLCDVEALGRSDDRCIDRAERESAVSRDQCRDPQPVTRRHRVDRERASGEVTEEPDLRLDAEPRGEQTGHLRDDQDGYDERTRVGRDKLEARFVMGVVGVDVGVQRPRVDEQRGYRSTSAARISSMRSETSLRPLRPAFAASSRRRPAPPTR